MSYVRLVGMGWIILAAVAPVVIAVFGYFGQRLVARNDAAHDKLWGEVKEIRVDVAELKTGQANINGKLDILVNGRGKDG